MTMRSKIEDIIWDKCHDGGNGRSCSLAAAAIMAALPDYDAQQARIAELEEVLTWYGEQTRLCRLVHSGGNDARHNLADDGGKRSRAALKAKP
tara:strand:+ start:1242 stop:1520 length:279 start_codon:yes stop_codon:yes gene_type:complete